MSDSGSDRRVQGTRSISRTCREVALPLFSKSVSLSALLRDRKAGENPLLLVA